MTGHVGWTRTLNESDAMELLDSVVAGERFESFRHRALASLPQAGRPRRVETIRLVRERLLDVDADVIQPSAFLRLFVGAPPPRRTALLWGRFTFGLPLVADVLDALVRPTLERAERVPAPTDAAALLQADWDAALRRVLRSGAPDSVLDKTRSTLQLVLGRCGVLIIEGTRSRSTIVRRGEPDALAFSWLVAHELASGHRTEMPQQDAMTTSAAARLFLPTPEHAAACLDAGVREGVLARSYLMGAARFHAPADHGRAT
jgi:hypothetical protein